MYTHARASTVFVTIAFVCLLVFVSAPDVRAQEFTSTNFHSFNPTINNFGGNTTSTSFTAFQSGDQTAQGESNSTSFVLQTGFLYFDSFAPKSQNWRWYDDAENETPSMDLAAENVAPTNISNANTIKLRLSIAETANVGATGVKLRLQFSTSSNFSESVRNVVEQISCSGSSVWCYGSGGGVDNVIITTGLLSDSDSCVASVGDGCGTHNEFGTTTSTFTHAQSAVTEYEFTVEQSGASASTVYFFRAFDSVSGFPIPLNTGESYPSLTADGGTLSFTINGLIAGTSTEGVTTEIETTPESVPFGTLSMDDPQVAAHRFVVSTNAGSGYKIFAYQRQGFINSGAHEIDPVTGTNGTPSGWTLGCAAVAAGCFGYHSGEDVLEGGSTRFAADDSFAAFTSNPREIAYNNGPATDKETDIIYKVQVRTEQESGDYSSSIVYIITPVF